ncbi:4-hydroxybenzoate polyprenyltransferase mitochondrial [Bienertia sinuspersici]
MWARCVQRCSMQAHDLQLLSGLLLLPGLLPGPQFLPGLMEVCCPQSGPPLLAGWLVHAAVLWEMRTVIGIEVKAAEVAVLLCATVQFKGVIRTMSITLAAEPGHLPDIKMLALFGCGALLLRGAGCTINDLLDQDIDVKVERTKLRPIASGLLTPLQGISFLGVQLLLGLGILLQLNNYSLLISPHEEADILGNRTCEPQAFLGLTFNWGALLGWTAVRGSLDPYIVLPLYMSGVCWTLVYDTIYAHQDKEDDLKVGVKSTALRFGDVTKEWLTGFGFACISSLALSGYNAHLGWPYYACLTAGSGHVAWQIYTVDLSNRF